VEQVFDFATDLDHASLFLPGVERIELLTPGALRAGSRFRETRRSGKKSRSAIIEVTEHTRPTVHAAKAAMAGMQAKYTFRFTPVDGETLVEMIAEVRGSWLWRPFLGLMARVMEKEDGEYLSRLKTAIMSQKA